MNKKAFTLIEVLMSIVLLTLVMFALFKNLSVVKKSTKNLQEHLKKSQKDLNSYKILYLDILQMVDKIEIISKEKNYDRVCFATKNSLYNLSTAHICWVVSKHENTLMRIENNKKFSLPLRGEPSLQKDIIKKNIKIFKLYRHRDRKKNQILVFIKDNKEVSFKVQAINKIKKPKKKHLKTKPKKPKKPKKNLKKPKIPTIK